MSLPRFFLDEQIVGEEVEPCFELRLSADDAKHAKVLRLRAGEHIAVVDASHDYFECQIEEFDGSLPLVSISQHLSITPRPYLALCQGLAKGDKMDTVIRHATELGVSAFIPLACERSVLKLDPKKADKKIERWQAIAKSAAMQSGQPSLPEVKSPLTVKQSIDELSNYDKVLIAWEEAPQTCGIRQALADLSTDSNDPDDNISRIAVIVGPEGGLSQGEVDFLLSALPQACLVSLGPSILRTETAGIVAPALVLYELGCLGDLS